MKTSCILHGFSQDMVPQKSCQPDCWEELLHSVGFNDLASARFLLQLPLQDSPPCTSDLVSQLFISTLIVANAIVIGLETDSTGEVWAVPWQPSW